MREMYRVHVVCVYNRGLLPRPHPLTSLLLILQQQSGQRRRPTKHDFNTNWIDLKTNHEVSQLHSLVRLSYNTLTRY